MRLFTTLAQAVAGITLCVWTAAASSLARDPLNYITTIDNAVIQTPTKRVHAFSSFDLTFNLHGHSDRFRLKLEPNYDILHEDAEVHIVGADGQVTRKVKINRQNHKVFQGTAFVVDNNGHSMHVGSARITVSRDGQSPLFQGVFSVLGNNHHIQSRSNYMSTKHALDPVLEATGEDYMAVWRDSDVGRVSHTELRKRMASPACAADALPFNSDLSHPLYQDLLKRSEGRWGVAGVDQLLGKRQNNIDGGGAGNTGNSAGTNLRQSIGNTAGCPDQRLVALVGIATDCSYFADFNRNRSAVEDNVVKVVNDAADLYQSSFNVTLGLKTLTILDQDCGATTSTSATPWNVACSDSFDMTARLNSFSTWRGQQGEDGLAYWSLFTKCNSGSEVGLAWLGQLCVQSGSEQNAGGTTQTVTGANVVARTGSEWQVFAHETGHTFGAVHDCDSTACANSQTVNTQQCCPVDQTNCDANGQYLMNPFSSPDIQRFSPCSIGNVCSAIGRKSVSTTCLTQNRDIATFTGPVCGNGIVEGDEQCDCGGEQGCQGNPCCNPTTCQFQGSAVCDFSNQGCCTRQCQFASAGSVCRPSTSVCDPEETCPGNNGTCPSDKTSDDGTGCGNGLQCASGQCTSRDQQCRTLMGVYTTGNDTYACNSQDCTLSCGSPEFGPNVCMKMNQNFLDGTPCGGNGRCNNGVCSGSNVGGQIKSWVDDNRTLVIALASVLGGLLVIGILSCIISCCRRRRRPRPAAAAAPRYQQPAQAGWQRPHGNPNQNMTQQQWNAPPGYQPYANYPRQQSVRYA